MTALAASGCDLHTKAWAEEVLQARPGHSLSMVKPWLELSLAYNHGTAFSLIPSLGQARWLFGVLALALTGTLLFSVVRTRPSPLEVLALGMIAGGGIGNGVERLAGTGVVDFIKVNYPWGGSWPTFNIADVLVVVGAIGFLLCPRRSRPVAHSASTDAASGSV